MSTSGDTYEEVNLQQRRGIRALARRMKWDYHVARTLGRVRRSVLLAHITTSGCSASLATPNSNGQWQISVVPNDAGYRDMPRGSMPHPPKFEDDDPLLSEDFLPLHKSKWCDCVVAVSIPEITAEIMTATDAAIAERASSNGAQAVGRRKSHRKSRHRRNAAAGKHETTDAMAPVTKHSSPANKQSKQVSNREAVVALRRDICPWLAPAKALLVLMPERVRAQIVASVRLSGCVAAGIIPAFALLAAASRSAIMRTDAPPDRYFLLIAEPRRMWILVFLSAGCVSAESIAVEAGQPVGEIVVALQQACSALSMKYSMGGTAPMYVIGTDSETESTANTIAGKAYHVVKPAPGLSSTETSTSHMVRAIADGKLVALHPFIDDNVRKADTSHRSVASRVAFFLTMLLILILGTATLFGLWYGMLKVYAEAKTQLQYMGVLPPDTTLPSDKIDPDKLLKEFNYGFVTDDAAEEPAPQTNMHPTHPAASSPEIPSIQRIPDSAAESRAADSGE